LYLRNIQNNKFYQHHNQQLIILQTSGKNGIKKIISENMDVIIFGTNGLIGSGLNSGTSILSDVTVYTQQSNGIKD
jgi:hypothetical protein